MIINFKKTIFYDVVARPANHFKAFYKLALFFESENLKQFNCFPLRTSYIPAYITLDTKIVNYHIIKSKKLANNKTEIWEKFISGDLKKKPFKNQGTEKALSFEGTIETDGVGVSIIKQNMATTRKNVSTTIVKKKLEPKNDATTYIESLTQAELENTSGKCVLIDPGRRDLLYCMKETSTVQKKELLIFRKTNRSKRSRHFRILRKVTKPNVIKNAEAILANTKSSTVDVGKFVEYIKTRSSVEKLMVEYYGNETQKSEEIYFPDSHFNFKVNDKGNIYFGNLYVTKIEDPLPENLTISQLYATYLRIMLQQKHIYKRLNNVVKTEVMKIASEMFANDQESLRQRPNKLLEKLQVLPFRKLKFSSKLYYDQNDEKLVRNLKKNFGSDAILVLGNWSAPNNKCHEPTRNKGLISMLKKNGLTAHIIDEFKTSSKCPMCEED